MLKFSRLGKQDKDSKPKLWHLVNAIFMAGNLAGIRGLEDKNPIFINYFMGLYHRLVPEAGLEPARFLRRGILNPLCLPISPLWQQGAKIMHGLQL